jgi:hypothetical protein
VLRFKVVRQTLRQLRKDVAALMEVAHTACSLYESLHWAERYAKKV